MSEFGIGASVLRKEDDRFLKGRGQYVGDYRLPGTRDVAFVRSPIAHGRLKSIRIPEEFRDCVYTADHLNNVKPIGTNAATVGDAIYIPAGGPLNGGAAQTNANQAFTYP